MPKITDFNKLIGKKVCIIKSSNPVAKVLDVVYSNIKNSVVCLVVDTGEWFSSPKVIPFNLVDISKNQDLFIQSVRHIVDPIALDAKLAIALESSKPTKMMLTAPRWNQPILGGAL